MTQTQQAKPRRRPAAKQPNLRNATATYTLERQVGFLLRLAHQRASELFSGVMDKFSVTPTQFAALAKLDDLGSASQNHLGRLTAMDPATISGVIGRLSTRGYVRQSPDPNDARLVLLTLTPSGAVAVKEMKTIAAEVSRRTLEPLTREEAAQFLRSLAKLG